MKYLQKIIFVLILLVCCCCSRDPVAPVLNNNGSAIPVNDIKGLSNFAKISETLYRGAQPDKEGFSELKKIGVKTVINLRSSHSDKSMMKGLGLRYLEIPIRAGDVSEENVIKFLKTVTNSENGVIFVHCQHGSDRTGMMIGAYRMYVQGWSREDAIAELANFGFHEIYKSIKRYIEGFDVDLMRQRVKSAADVKLEIVL